MTTLIDRPEDKSVMNTKELLSDSDLDNLLGVRDNFEELQSMDTVFTNAIQQITSARQNIDREIASFNILDQFIYDPDNIQKVDEYRSQIQTVVGTTDLNPVNSAMALGTKAVLEAVRFAKEVDPRFELSDLETRVETLQEENDLLTGERNRLEMESAMVAEVVVLAQQVETKHSTLQTNLKRYTQEVQQRSSTVERTFRVINSLNLPLPTNPGVDPSEQEARAGHNTLLFMTSCMRT